MIDWFEFGQFFTIGFYFIIIIYSLFYLIKYSKENWKPVLNILTLVIAIFAIVITTIGLCVAIDVVLDRIFHII